MRARPKDFGISEEENYADITWDPFGNLGRGHPEIVSPKKRRQTRPRGMKEVLPAGRGHAIQT